MSEVSEAAGKTFDFLYSVVITKYFHPLKGKNSVPNVMSGQIYYTVPSVQIKSLLSVKWASATGAHSAMATLKSVPASLESQQQKK